MPVLSADAILLPDYANVGGAHQETTPIPNPAPAANGIYKIGGSNFEVPIIVNCSVITSALAGNRAIDLQIVTADGVTVAFVVPAALQGPAVQQSYMWLLGYSNSLGGVTGGFLGPIPPIVLFPGWSLVVFLNAVQAGDQIVNLSVTANKFPTGTPASELPTRTAPATV